MTAPLTLSGPINMFYMTQKSFTYMRIFSTLICKLTSAAKKHAEIQTAVKKYIKRDCSIQHSPG